jgi:folate/biopterin transporter
MATSGGSTARSSKGRGTGVLTLAPAKGLETAPLLVNDGPLPSLVSDHDKGYQTIDMMAPSRDFGSANPVLRRAKGDGNGEMKSVLADRETTLVLICAGWVMFLEGVNGMSGLAFSYFMKNTLKVEPAVLTSISSITALPWTCKPLYGFISDAFPIWGYRRRPYFFIAGIFGCLSWVLMSRYVHTAWQAGACMTIGSGAIAIANVIAEALVVEKSRGENKEYASRLQSIIWSGQAVGGIIAAWTGGFILTFMTDKQVFLLVSTFPLTLMGIALLVPEQRYVGDASQERGKISSRLQALWGAFSQPEIYKPCVFIFLLNATPSTGASWFYFYTDTLKFSSTFLGTIGLVGSVCTLIGVYVFDATLKKVSFRPIFLWSTIVSTILGLTQLMLVFRTNVALGIPDWIFCLGESAILSIVGWICTMPVIVLASRLCPEGMEGTMYALIMSINNLGGIIGSQLGAVLTTWLGVTEKNMDNFWLLVFLCNASTVLPLVLINWIPEEDPDVDKLGVQEGVPQHGGYSTINSITETPRERV